MKKDKRLMLMGLLLALVFIGIGTIWLSNSTETLDRTAEHFGIKPAPIWNPIIPDYEISGYKGNIPIDITVGIIFTLVVFVVTIYVGKAVKTENEAVE